MTHFKLIVVMVLEKIQVYNLFYQYPLLLALLIVNSFLQPLDYFNYFVKKKNDWGDFGSRVQTSSYKMTRIWGSNVQHVDCS